MCSDYITLHVIHVIYIYYLTIKLTSIFHNLKKMICLLFFNKNHCTKIKCKSCIYMAIKNNVKPSTQKLLEKKIFR